MGGHRTSGGIWVIGNFADHQYLNTLKLLQLFISYVTQIQSDKAYEWLDTYSNKLYANRIVPVYYNSGLIV